MLGTVLAAGDISDCCLQCLCSWKVEYGLLRPRSSSEEPDHYSEECECCSQGGEKQGEPGSSSCLYSTETPSVPSCISYFVLCLHNLALRFSQTAKWKVLPEEILKMGGRQN